MKTLTYLGWVRDSKGRVVIRPPKTIANAVTTLHV